MQIDPRLNEIDDALYRVAARALIVQDAKVLLVKELDGDGYWSIPGGGVDHGENVESCLVREIEEELGIPKISVAYDLTIVHYTIGTIYNGVPRMNLYFNASIPKELIKQTAHTHESAWFTKDEFLKANLNPFFKSQELLSVIF